MKGREKQKKTAVPAAPHKRKPRLQVPPPSLDQIPTHPEHQQYRNRKDLHLRQLARGDPMLRDPCGAIIEIIMAPPVNGPNIADSGGTETGPAAAGFSGADFSLLRFVKFGLDVAW